MHLPQPMHLSASTTGLPELCISSFILLYNITDFYFSTKIPIRPHQPK
jgi:hypothetical protein